MIKRVNVQPATANKVRSHSSLSLYPGAELYTAVGRDGKEIILRQVVTCVPCAVL